MSAQQISDTHKYSKIVTNANIYGLCESVRASKFPMSTDARKENISVTGTVHRLGLSDVGTGHNNFLKGIVVQFDLTFTVKAWTEAERYHWFDIVSSQSSMHRLTRMDLDTAYIQYVDAAMIARMKELVERYNDDPTPENYLVCLYSNPCGLKLTAGITTNYLQLKTMYQQRKNHRLPEWRLFCSWMKTLPYCEWITGNDPD